MILLSDIDIGVTHVNNTDPQAVIQSTWAYMYDLFDCPTWDPDMSVQPDWIGRHAKEVCPVSWKEFLIPVVSFDI